MNEIDIIYFGYGLKVGKLKTDGKILEMIGIWKSWEMKIDLLLTFVTE